MSAIRIQRALAPTVPAPAANDRLLALSAQRQGQGEARVVMLHGSTASRAMWSPLMTHLGGLPIESVAIDLHGHGRSEAWPEGVGGRLSVDASAAWATAGLDAGEVHLVGHSYGGAVALQMALMHPSKVRSITLYEPVPFGLLTSADAAACAEILGVAQRLGQALDRGDAPSAARDFVNYWADGDAWSAASEGQRERLLARIGTVRHHFDALFAAAWTGAQLQRLAMPVMLMFGTRTRAPARALAGQLAASLPRVQAVPLPGAGHLGPVSHAEVVAAYFATRIVGSLSPAAASTAARAGRVSLV